MRTRSRKHWPEITEKLSDAPELEAMGSVLRMVAHTLANSLKPGDVVCRWDGEEFLAIIQ